MVEEAQPKDWQKTRDAAYAAKLAYVFSQPDKYKNKPELTQYLLEKLDGYKLAEKRQDNVYVLFATPKTKDKPALIGFAGSDDRRDWMEDLVALPSANHGAHLGFDTMYKRINPKESPVITNFIDSMHQQGVETYVSGHSMGGALATLAGKQHGDKYPLHIVTLNAPTTGLFSTINVNTLDKLDTTNFIKRGDIVSMTGSASFAGDTYIVEDIPVGDSYMVTHEKRGTKATDAIKRSVGNVMNTLFSKPNFAAAHSSESMLNYIEKLAEKNQQIKGVNVSFSDLPPPADTPTIKSVTAPSIPLGR